ncbi:MAG: Rhodanese-like protein [Proteobacteria bacterium]|nr:Rhodanese-like protein [Pseudomonadota bacterium]
MRRLLLSLCLALAPLLAQAELIDIDNAELERLMKNGVPLIDIRTTPEWQETGIIANSRLLTFFDEQGQVDAAAWLEKLKPIAKPNQPVIIICRSGNRSKAAGQFLSQQAAYSRVYNVKSGIKGWLGNGGAVMPANQSIAACRSAKTC